MLSQVSSIEIWKTTSDRAATIIVAGAEIATTAAAVAETNALMVEKLVKSFGWLGYSRKS